MPATACRVTLTGNNTHECIDMAHTSYRKESQICRIPLCLKRSKHHIPQAWCCLIHRQLPAGVHGLCSRMTD